MKHLVASFLKDESGATAVEYGLLVAFIAVTMIGAMLKLKESFTDVFGRVASAMPVD